VEELPRLLVGGEFTDTNHPPIFTKAEEIVQLMRHRHLYHKWDALEKFFSRPWWSRVWVIQELFLAREAKLYCGRLIVQWNAIAALCMLLTRNQPTMSYAVKQPGAIDTARRAISSMDMAMGMQGIALMVQTDRPLSLLGLLDFTRGRTASDPRDHVYGIVGLLRKECTIAPDYELSLPETYTRAAILHMKESRTMDVLSYVFHRVQPPDRILLLPSWVPDWRYSRRMISFGVVGQPRRDSFYTASADRESPLPFIFSKNLRELQVAGFVVATIEKCGRVCSLDKPSDAVRDWRRSIHEVSSMPYFGRCSILEAFWRTVLGDLWLHEQGIQRLHKEIKGLASLPPTGEQETLLLSYLDMACGGNFCLGRRLFRTEIGLIGLGSESIKPGDVVVVLFGGSVPFIVRTAGNGRYFFICDW
jgi:hypothetical protein